VYIYIHILKYIFIYTAIAGGDKKAGKMLKMLKDPVYLQFVDEVRYMFIYIDTYVCIYTYVCIFIDACHICVHTHVHLVPRWGYIYIIACTYFYKYIYMYVVIVL
jgi:hypothetical protein